LNQLRENPPDLVLLDVRMPGMDGLEVCRALKSDPKTVALPVLMISTQSSEADVVAGLEMGATDYVCKPFRERELQARVKAVLRRNVEDSSSPTLSAGPLQLDPATFTASLDGQSLDLRIKEYQLLQFFIQREGKVLTRAVISEQVWGHEYDRSMRTIDRHVANLRKKLGRHANWIQALPGIGYRFEREE
jgi:DNA-binding response OmpR family regulator